MFEEYKDILTTEELAQMLRINEKTIEKLAHEKKLPAALIDSEFRFLKDKIVEWLEMEINRYSDELFLEEMEKGVLKRALTIHTLLKPSHIEMNLKAKTKEEAMKELAHLSYKTGLVKNEEELLKFLNSREELCSTAVDNHIAFPHPRTTTWNLVKNFVLVVAISQEGIDFGASDKKPVRIFILQAIPHLSLHLQLLSRLARLFKEDDLPKKLYAAKTPEEVIAAIKEKEQSIQEKEDAAKKV